MVGGLHQTGTTLIKRGTAMGPLIPALLLVPLLAFFAWLFSDITVIAGIPAFSALCFASLLGVVGHYLYHYSKFARNDPDRLQSEQYRVQMQELQVQLIAAKDLPGPVPADMLEDATPNPNAPEQSTTGADHPEEAQEEQHP